MTLIKKLKNYFKEKDFELEKFDEDLIQKNTYCIYDNELTLISKDLFDFEIGFEILEEIKNLINPISLKVITEGYDQLLIIAKLS